MTDEKLEYFFLKNFFFRFRMARVNPKNVLNLLLEEFRDIEETEVTAHDEDMKDKILELINSYMVGGIHVEDTLDIDDDDDEEYNEPNVDESTDEEQNPPVGQQSSTDYEPPDEPSTSNDPYPTTAKKAEIIDYWKNQTVKRRPFRSMKKRFRLLTCTGILYRWEKLLESGK